VIVNQIFKKRPSNHYLHPVTEHCLWGSEQRGRAGSLWWAQSGHSSVDLRGRLPARLALEGGGLSDAHLDRGNIYDQWHHPCSSKRAVATKPRLGQSLGVSHLHGGPCLSQSARAHLSSSQSLGPRPLARSCLVVSSSLLGQTPCHVFTGTSVSCIPAIPQARLRLHSLFDCQEEYRPRSTLHRAQLRDLVWWTELTFDSLSNGALSWPPVASVSMWTDASCCTGFCNVLEVPAQSRRTHGSFWRKEDIPLPICVKEIKAVKFGLIEHADVLQGRTVRLFQDNQAVVGAMRAFSSSSPAMMVEVREIWSLPS
jgi:hypothetical protein